MSGELGSKVASWGLSSIAIDCPSDFGNPFIYQSQGHWRDVPQSPISHPMHPMVHCDGMDTWDWGIGHGTLCGTSQVIPSHPMGLIGIAATVPGTFGISNVPMDICWQSWKCGPLISSRTISGNMHLLITRHYSWWNCSYNLHTHSDNFTCHTFTWTNWSQACRLAGLHTVLLP